MSGDDYDPPNEWGYVIGPAGKNDFFKGGTLKVSIKHMLPDSKDGDVVMINCVIIPEKEAGPHE